MMDTARLGSSDRRYATWIGATAALFVLVVVIGFVWLPAAQRGAGAPDLWTSICRAIGLPSRDAGVGAAVPGQPASTVAWTPATRQLLARGDIRRGAALASTCNNCHGANGVSTDAAIPNLAGQSASAIYKQLEDFRSGRRNPALMGVFVAPLSDQDLIDLAVHFAALPEPFARAASMADPADAGARRLIELGDPVRAIASCGACHGPLGLLPGAPGLRGQQRAYLEEQLQAFKAAIRRNDVGESMRSVARQLSGAEIARLAAYYASFPAATGK
jgi:cytochrome c553